MKGFGFGRIEGYLFNTLLIIGMIAGLTTVMKGQTDTARIQGSVMDATGAIIPGATIKVTNLGTGSVYDTTSDSNGNFNLSALPVGAYKAEVQSSGFQSEVQNFTLTVSQVQAMNFKLATGVASTVVEVTDAAPLVDTTTSSTGTLIQGRQLAELPLNGRNFTQLALLAPGVTRGAYGGIASGVNGNAESLRYNDTGGYSLAANGLRAQANSYILDGIDNNESLTNGISFFVPVEAMSEFRVTNSLAPAEFGRAGGVIIQAAIKSGTNAIHGSAFIFYRDSALGSANPNYFSPSTKIVSYHRNQFGGTLGGPLWKNKLFLFGDYQGLREDLPQGVYISSTPTARMRSGDFGELIGSGLTVVPNVAGGTNYSPTGCASFTTVTGRVVKTTAQLNGSGSAPLADSGAIFDPLTCKQFGTVAAPNVIPASRLNKAAVNYLNAFPAANHASPNVLNNYANIQTSPNRYNDFDVRLDYNLSPHNILFVRYSYAQDDESKTTRYVGLPSGFGTGSNNTHPRGVAAGFDHIFNANIVNEFRFGYSRPFYGYINPFEGEPFSANLGIVNANRNALLGGGALIGGNDTEIGYTGDGGPYEVPQHAYQYLDSLSYNHGKHAFKFGGNIIQRQVDFFQGDYRSKGFFNIAGNGADYTGYEVSELLAAFVDNYSIANPLGFYQTRSWENGFYAQDDWKLSQRLTLNLGIRYDLLTYPYEVNNRQSNFDIASGSLKVAGANGNSRSLIDTNFKNFAPRVGFAYDASGNGKTVFRGGYGIYYFLDRGGVGNQLSNNPDFNGASQFTSQQGYRVTFSGQGPAFDNNNDHATAPLPSATSVINEAAPTNAAVISYPKNNPNSTIQQYNLQMEQQLGPNTVIDIAYVGTKADHLFNVINYTGKQLGTGLQFFQAKGLGVTLDTNNGTSRYNGLQTRLNRRLTNGLQFTAAYTWSHAIDDSTGPFSVTPNASSTFFITAAGPQLQYNRGNTDDDQRHAFTFSMLGELPFGRGKMFGGQVNRAVDYVIGGWQINPFVQLGTGTPFNLNANNNGGGINNRPDFTIVPPNIGVHKNHGVVTYFNPAAFTSPPVNSQGLYFRPGQLGRNQLYGPGYDTVSVSVIKQVPVTERIKGELRGQAYNLFNTPQFAGIADANISDNNGTINTTRFRSERELELAFRFTF